MHRLWTLPLSMQQCELRDFCFLGHQAFGPLEDVCPCWQHSSGPATLLHNGPGERKFVRLQALGFLFGSKGWRQAWLSVDSAELAEGWEHSGSGELAEV